MSRNKLIFSLVVVALMTGSFTLVSDNGRAGYTGSPGEATCSTTNCHTGQANNSQGGSVVISSPDLIDWVYTPGVTYNISVTVTQEGRSLFGTGFEALLSNGQNAGLLIDGLDNQIKSKTVNGVSRKNIVHIENGGATMDSHTFTFTWTAPAAGMGDVMFYCAGNAANGNGLRTGDFIYTTSQLVTPLPADIKVEPLTNVINISLYPNPASEVLNVQYSLLAASAVEMKVMSTDGKNSWIMKNELQQAGEIKNEIPVSHLSPGVYLLVMTVNGKEYPARLFRR